MCRADQAAVHTNDTGTGSKKKTRRQGWTVGNHMAAQGRECIVAKAGYFIN